MFNDLHNYDEMLAQSKAARMKFGKAGPLAAPTGKPQVQIIDELHFPVSMSCSEIATAIIVGIICIT